MLMLLESGPLLNVTLQVPLGLGLIFGAAFVVYAIKSIM
jgi:hypothetical protein